QRQQRAHVPLPDGITSGNGRIEAIQVDIATKYAGRIGDVLAREGSMVAPDELLAHMDTAEMQAELAKAQAQLAKSVEDVARAAADVVQKEAAAELAANSFARAETLKRNKAIADQDFDESRARRDSSAAAVNVAKAALRSAEKAELAATAEVSRQTAQIAEMTLKCPVRGRVLYRLAEPGMVLPAGGKVLTVLDLSDIYMEIFLPSREAARVRVGSEARIVLDVAPDYAARAKVTFVSPEAQFTPKQVETRSERDKLMFRVKLQLPPELILPHLERMKTGLRGVGYVRLDETVAWPDFLERRFPQTPPREPSPTPTPASDTQPCDTKAPDAKADDTKTPDAKTSAAKTSPASPASHLFVPAPSPTGTPS
ncbi:MAG: HlyD family secretion protein, partial [Planctomycetaceae bacterium]